MPSMTPRCRMGMGFVIRRYVEVGLIAATLAVSACGRDSAGRAEPQAAVVGPETCEGISIRAVPVDSFASVDRCALLRASLAAIRAGKLRPGVERADAESVTRALLTPLSEADETGFVANPTWRLGLSLKDKPYDVEVVVVRSTREMEVYRMHKPLGRTP
jgi:hypothetical protein